MFAYLLLWELLKFSRVATCVCFFLSSPWAPPIGEWLCVVFTLPLYIWIQQLEPRSLPVLTLIFPALSAMPCCSPLAVLWSSTRLFPVRVYMSCWIDSYRAQDATGLHCCKSTLRIRVQIVYSQILFSKATLQLVSTQPVLLHGANLSQIQDSAFAFVELHVVSISPFLQVVVVPLSSSLALQWFTAAPTNSISSANLKGILSYCPDH